MNYEVVQRNLIDGQRFVGSGFDSSDLDINRGGRLED